MLAALPGLIAIVVFAIVSGKDLPILGATWLACLWIFVTSIPKRDRAGLWLAGTFLVLTSLNVLESSHVHIWSGGQFRDLSSVVAWLAIISLAWYAVTRDDSWAADLYRRLRSRLRSRQQPPPTPLDDL
jgi:hypothetical protein